MELSNSLTRTPYELDYLKSKLFESQRFTNVFNQSEIEFLVDCAALAPEFYYAPRSVPDIPLKWEGAFRSLIEEKLAKLESDYRLVSRGFFVFSFPNGPHCDMPKDPSLKPICQILVPLATFPSNKESENLSMDSR